MSEVTLHHGDCLDILPTLEAGSVDAIFADPPFNVGKKYDETDDNRSDYYEWCERWIRECFRVLKDTGSIYLMTLDQHLENKYPIMKKYGVFINQVNWKNVSANHGKKQFWNISQPILVYGKTEEYKFNTYAQVRSKNQARDIWSRSRAKRAKRRLFNYWDDIPLIYAGSVIHPEAILEPGTNRKAHPCQSPVGLSKRAVIFSSDEGDTILDPFMGSGTTGVACVQTGRNFIGIDVSEKYIDIAEKRIKEAQLQIRMPI